MRFVFLVICSACLVLGCNNRNPTPENMDPIYQDLKAEIGVAENELKGIAKDTADKMAKAQEVNESWRMKQRLWAEYYKALRLETHANERVLYLKTKLESRLEDDRLKYNLAMNEGKAWPNPQEVLIYRKNRVARSIS
ncbi:MAG: hypothetical protein K2X47_20025, partial [Bdellovibrionales bacterium]|nr:hypothetical protein [Bdellovibrionales bacterium]